MGSNTIEDAARAVEEKIDATRESLGQKVGRVREKVGDVADEVKSRAGTLRDRIRDTDWEGVKGNVASYVRKNPAQSMAIALGVGFVLGLLLRRRDD